MRLSFTYSGGPLDGRRVENLQAPDGYLGEHLCVIEYRSRHGRIRGRAQGRYLLAREGGRFTATHVPSPEDRPFPAPEPLPIPEAKALLEHMVAAGETTPGRAALIDIREPTPSEVAHGESLGPAAKKARARRR